MMSRDFDEKAVEKIKRAREERREIVAKYDRGREDGAVIDDWEDPKFDIYHKKDRYGFIHDHRLPEIVSRSAREQKALDKEMGRVDKWLVMIQEKAKWFPEKASNHKKLVERVWKGIPGRLRGEVWRVLLNVDELKEMNSGTYARMKERGRSYSKEVRQVDLDVNRTYRNHEMFRERYNIKQKELFDVLVAYSVYNTEVSYCQGMSQVAALLLMFLPSDEDAFWGLHRLMVEDKFNMHAFFIPSFPKLQRFQDIHDKVLLKKLKKVQKHLISHGMDSGIYSIKWFLQCYIGAIPFSLTLRVWDALLLEGDTVIPAMAFNILKLNQKSILKMDMDQINELLQKTLPSDFGFDEDTVIESLKDCLAELRSSKLLWTDPIPESERPKLSFGAVSLEDYEIQTMLESGKRSAVNEDDRKFHRNTLQREQDNILNLRHIDSQDSIDDVDEESEASLDKSLSLDGGVSDESLERDDATPTEDKLKDATDLLATSLQKLDKSLEFLMSQANISDQTKGRQRDRVKQISFVEPAEVEERARPASAGPLSSRARVREHSSEAERKRRSAHIPGERGVTQLTASHHRPCASVPRLTHRHSSGRLGLGDTSGACSRLGNYRSSSSSSRDINLSSDSAGPDSGRSSANKSPHPHHPQHLPKLQHHRNSQRAQNSRNSPRPDSKNSYIFGETASRNRSPLTPELRPKPKSRYFFGDTPDLAEILHNLDYDDNNDVAVFEDVKTPVNEPPPEFRDNNNEDEGRRLLTQEHNMRLLASARAMSPAMAEQLRLRPPEQTKERAEKVSCNKHRTWGVVNRSVETRHVRSASDRQSRGIMGGEGGISHRTSRDLYMTEYREQRTPSNRNQRSRTQSHHLQSQNQSHNYSYNHRDFSQRQMRQRDQYFYKQHSREEPPQPPQCSRPKSHSRHHHVREQEVWQRQGHSSLQDPQKVKRKNSDTYYSNNT